MELFLVFQWRDDVPEVQGVFSTKERAEEECLDDRYCVCPLTLDESRGHDRQETWQGSYFPKATLDL